MTEEGMWERIGSLAAKATAAHDRIDKLETGLRDDLKEIKQELKSIAAWMNRGKGWAAAAMLLAGMGGAAVIELGKLALHR